MDKVIIDGVDVSECKHFFSDDMCDNEHTLSCICVRNKECKYKQLKRLEQENERLKKELKKYEDMAKKGLEEFKDVGGCWGCGLQLQLNQDIEDIKQLKAGNERLKEENEQLKFQLDNAPLKVLDTYKQALQEIRGIAEKMYNTNDEDTERDLHIELQDKINEVIGEK